MTREEAIVAGMEVQETKHSMKRRTPWHDYSRKGTYMLTLVVSERAALFGTLRCKANAARAVVAEGTALTAGTVIGEGGTLTVGVAAAGAYVELSALGRAIAEEEIQKIHKYYPLVEVWKLCIMPDHLHIIVRVKEDMDERKHLGQVVAGFKGGCSKAAMRLGATVLVQRGSCCRSPHGSFIRRGK